MFISSIIYLFIIFRNNKLVNFFNEALRNSNCKEQVQNAKTNVFFENRIHHNGDWKYNPEDDDYNDNDYKLVYII